MAQSEDRFDKEVNEMLRKIYKISSGQELEKELKERLRRKYQTLNDRELKNEIRGEIEEEFEHNTKKKYEGISDEDLDRIIEYELKGVIMGGDNDIPDELKEKIRERARRKRNLEEEIEKEREEIKKNAIDAEEQYEEKLNKTSNYMNDNNYLTKCARVMIFGPILLALLGTFIGKPIYNKIKANNTISQIAISKKVSVNEKKRNYDSGIIYKEIKSKEEVPIEYDSQEIYKEIEQFGKDWTDSECSKYNDEEFIKIMASKATHNRIKLPFKCLDGISKESNEVVYHMTDTENIPDQLQAGLNCNDVLILFCDKNKEGTYFSPPSDQHLAEGYYQSVIRNIVLSSKASPSVIIHEAGHAFEEFMGESLANKIIYNPSSVFYKISEGEDCKEKFATAFERYYSNLWSRNGNRQKFKERFPEEYAFFRKFEALMIEKSLKNGWIERGIRREESNKKYGLGRFLEGRKGFPDSRYYEYSEK